MDHVFTYSRGALVVDIHLGGEPYRIERRLRDEDTGVGLYVIKRIDSDTEVLRNGKLIDSPTCFRRYVSPALEND
jgi:hypothetical protein